MNPMKKVKNENGRGAPQRDYKAVQANIKVPVSTKAKLEKAAKIHSLKYTEFLVQMIHKNNEAFKPKTNGAGDENKKQNEFVNAYVREHYGAKPEDEEIARSEALKAYYNEDGLSFGKDEETFILPEE